MTETGAGYALYQGSSWLVRKYGVNFGVETFKEWAAQRGDIKRMDWSHILVSTATSKLGIMGKVGAELFNATNDFTIKNGWQNSFMSATGPYNKSFHQTFVDGAFGILNTSTGEVFVKDINIDQVKYQFVNSVDCDPSFRDYDPPLF